MKTIIERSVLACAVAAVAGTATAQPCVPEWSVLEGGGFNDTVRDMVVFDDGTGPAIYAAGHFATAGGGAVNRIAKWDGHAWTALAGGTAGSVIAMTVFEDRLYAAGQFASIGGTAAVNVAKWDGTSWTALGTGIGPSGESNNWVNALAVYDGAVYAAGNFTPARGAPGTNIAKWDGAAWSAVGAGVGGQAYAMGVFQGELYVGGQFTSPANRIAKWNGTSWSSPGTGTGSSVVRAIAVHDDGSGLAMYVGGAFTTAGGVSASRIAKWDGSSWSALGAGVNNEVLAITPFDDGSGNGLALYVGGSFTSAGGSSASRIAKWDGHAWSAMGAGVNNSVFSRFAVFNDGEGSRLYAAGSFTSAGGQSAARVARWGCDAVAPPSCYANCDDSTSAPVLNVADFTCFLQSFAAGEAYANCDESTTAPVLNVGDFTCFLQRFALGCD